MGRRYAVDHIEARSLGWTSASRQWKLEACEAFVETDRSATKIRSFPMSALNGAVITWLGHATVHISTPKGTSILIDPFIEHNPMFPKGYKFPEKIDLILLTHGHGDHISDAVPMAKKYGSTVVAIHEIAIWIGTKGIKNAVGMNIGGTFKFRDVRATMVEAKHSSSIQDGETFLYGGEPAGFVLRIDGVPTIYHAGDTAVFSDMQLIKELYAPEWGLLPIGDHYTMGPDGAALAAKYLGVKTILPIHFGTFPPLTGRPADLEKLLAGTGVEVKEIQPGEQLK